MPLSEFAPVERSLMSARAYEIIRDAIIRGDLAPGEQIRDVELAKRVGISRTPVREAINRLEVAGLIISKPGVYTRVATLNKHDVLATLSVLEALDRVAVTAGVPRLTSSDIDRMEHCNARFEAAVEAHDVDQALIADDEFHRVLVDAAENPCLSRVMDQLHPQLHRILYRKFSTLLGATETATHHKELISLSAQGKVADTVRVSSEHWAHLGGLIDRLFDENMQ